MDFQIGVVFVRRSAIWLLTAGGPAVHRGRSGTIDCGTIDWVELDCARFATHSSSWSRPSPESVPP